MIKSKNLDRYVRTNNIFYLNEIVKIGYANPIRGLHRSLTRLNMYAKRVNHNEFKLVSKKIDLHKEFFKEKKVPKKKKDDYLTRYMKRQLVD